MHLITKSDQFQKSRILIGPWNWPNLIGSHILLYIDTRHFGPVWTQRHAVLFDLKSDWLKARGPIWLFTSTEWPMALSGPILIGWQGCYPKFDWLWLLDLSNWPNFWLVDPFWPNGPISDWLALSGPISDWLALSGHGWPFLAQSGPISNWLTIPFECCVRKQTS